MEFTEEGYVRVEECLAPMLECGKELFLDPKKYFRSLFTVLRCMQTDVQGLQVSKLAITDAQRDAVAQLQRALSFVSVVPVIQTASKDLMDSTLHAYTLLGTIIKSPSSLTAAPIAAYLAHVPLGASRSDVLVAELTGTGNTSPIQAVLCNADLSAMVTNLCASVKAYETKIQRGQNASLPGLSACDSITCPVGPGALRGPSFTFNAHSADPLRAVIREAQPLVLNNTDVCYVDRDGKLYGRYDPLAPTGEAKEIVLIGMFHFRE